MEIVTRAIGALRPDPKNARRHDAKNIEAIKKSIAIFGQQKPIVIDDQDQVIAGNGTLEAAKQLGLTTLKCVVSDLDTIEKKAYAIADNRTGELAEWDVPELTEQLADLKTHFNTDLLCFDVDLSFEKSSKPSRPERPLREHVATCPACGFEFTTEGE
jgi:ParB-like chromosome segregation protein Spo0J